MQNFAENQLRKPFYDGAQTPLLAVNLVTDVQVWVSDPKIFQELLQTNSASLDKDGFLHAYFKILLRDALVFQPREGTDMLKKRKHAMQGFYKGMLAQMTEVMKTVAQDRVSKLQEKDSNLIDISTEFQTLFQSIIVTTIFGADIKDTEVEIHGLDGKTVKMPLRHAIMQTLGDILSQLRYRLVHPLNLFWNRTKDFAVIGAQQNIVNDNCTKLRAIIKSVVDDRKKGDKKPDLNNNFNFLDHFLTNQDAFSSDDIVDFIADYFRAASTTLQEGCITIYSYFIKNPEAAQKLRAEFDRIAQEEMEQDESLRRLSTSELFKRVVRPDNINDFTYLGQVVNEGLRFNTPLAASFSYKLLKDVTVGNNTFLEGDKVVFVMDQGVHRNTSQWQRPNEFLPDRFNPESPLYLTPEGKQRHPMSHATFMYGSRICIGKSLAEIALRVAILYYAYNFDGKFTESNKYQKPDDFPLAMFMQTKTIPIPVELTKA